MFKQCNVCQHKWLTRDAFIADPDITIIGYQANFDDLEAGHLFFNHSCNNTIVLPTDRFSDLYNGPVFSGPKTGTDECPQYCLKKGELTPCRTECECAYVREIIQLFNRAEQIKFV